MKPVDHSASAALYDEFTNFKKLVLGGISAEMLEEAYLEALCGEPKSPLASEVSKFFDKGLCATEITKLLSGLRLQEDPVGFLDSTLSKLVTTPDCKKLIRQVCENGQNGTFYFAGPNPLIPRLRDIFPELKRMEIPAIPLVCWLEVSFDEGDTLLERAEAFSESFGKMGKAPFFNEIFIVDFAPEVA